MTPFPERSLTLRGPLQRYWSVSEQEIVKGAPRGSWDCNRFSSLMYFSELFTTTDFLLKKKLTQNCVRPVPCLQAPFLKSEIPSNTVTSVTSPGNYKQCRHSLKQQKPRLHHFPRLGTSYREALSVAFLFKATPSTTPYSLLHTRDCEKHLTSILFYHHVTPRESITTQAGSRRTGGRTGIQVCSSV